LCLKQGKFAFIYILYYTSPTDKKQCVKQTKNRTNLNELKIVKIYGGYCTNVNIWKPCGYKKLSLLIKKSAKLFGIVKKSSTFAKPFTTNGLN